ncbi:hypothetical protein CEXT_725691 [Caerostris extrusa]|uniref:Uncharacterized protein n=1 Tax=Caerostris extrusa TaxID=172846 RepID=A0AAV4MJH6_CAEEX|nr:hypothetical protein CEXT_725691 [Caerostris extrusa]
MVLIHMMMKYAHLVSARKTLLNAAHPFAMKMSLRSRLLFLSHDVRAALPDSKLRGGTRPSVNVGQWFVFWHGRNSLALSRLAGKLPFVAAQLAPSPRTLDCSGPLKQKQPSRSQAIRMPTLLALFAQQVAWAPALFFVYWTTEDASVFIYLFTASRFLA